MYSRWVYAILFSTEKVAHEFINETTQQTGIAEKSVHLFKLLYKTTDVKLLIKENIVASSALGLIDD